MIPSVPARSSPARWIPRMRKETPGRRATCSRSSRWLRSPRAVISRRRRRLGRQYFYAHEGIELAWRVCWDQEKRVEYPRGDLRIGHPVMEPTRHDDYYFKNARNRVWLARRAALAGRSPGPTSAPGPSCTWSATEPRCARGGVAGATAGSPRRGLRGSAPGSCAGDIVRMTRHGRLPVL